MSDAAHIQFRLKPDEQRALRAYREDVANSMVLGSSANGFVYERLIETMREKGYFDPVRQNEIRDRIHRPKRRAASPDP